MRSSNVIRLADYRPEPPSPAPMTVRGLRVPRRRMSADAEAVVRLVTPARKAAA